MRPLVSVVITSYNYAEYICTAIDSVLTQDYENLEVVVTDNRSTDDTLTVLERYRDDPRVRINVNAENIGITRNINVGVSLAKGEFLVVLSADDWLMPGYVRRLVGLAETYPEAGLVYANAFFFRSEKVVDGVRHVLGQTLIEYTSGREELGWLLSACYMCLPTILFRRELFDRFGAFDDAFEIASDWEITLRMIRGGVKTAYIPVPLVGVRMHGRQASGAGYVKSGGELVEHLTLIDRYLDDSSDRHHGRELRAVDALNGRYDILKNAAPEMITPELQEHFDGTIARLRASNDKRRPKSDPNVAVIVTSTGRMVSLGACLESIAWQTHRNWDVWLLQDQGFDMWGFAQKYIPRERLHYSRTTDRFGPPIMRSTGFMLASGDYYIFVDEDTQLAPRHFEELIKAAQRGEGVGVAGTIVQFNQAEEGFGWHPLGNTEATYPLLPTNADLLVANCLPISAVMFDPSVVGELKQFESGLGILSEWEFLLRLVRIRAFSYTGTRTLIEQCFTGLRNQALQLQFGTYLPCMEAIYERFTPPSVDVLKARERHREVVTELLRLGPASFNDVQKLFALYNGLAGTGILAREAAPA